MCCLIGKPQRRSIKTPNVIGVQTLQYFDTSPQNMVFKMPKSGFYLSKVIYIEQISNLHCTVFYIKESVDT